MAAGATAVKVGLFVKDHWKELIVVVFAVLMIIMLLPVIVIGALFPTSTPDFVEDYKKIANVANVSWIEMLTLDTVRYDNNFENLEYEDIKDTALDFYSVKVKEYKKEKYYVRVPDGKDKDGKPKYKYVEKTKWVLDKTRNYTGHSRIKGFLISQGYNVDGNFRNILNAFNNLDKSKKYEIIINYRDFSDIISNLSEEKQEWANQLLASNGIPQIYGEYIELPDHIDVVINGFFAFPAPTCNHIGSGFGWRIHPILKRRMFHYGVDISGPSCHGDPIISVAPGKVVQVSYSNGAAGYFVKIRHKDHDGNEWFSRYLHMSQIDVEQGDYVERGDVIGAIGNTGRSTDSHLHFELYFEGQPVDPMKYIN